MNAMLLKKLTRIDEDAYPLEFTNVPVPQPQAGEILIQISCCGVCHTELDEIEGRTPPPQLPVIPGHQVVGKVGKLGRDTKRFKLGDRVGVAWIYSACGKCEFCLAGFENLCASFVATGRDVNGGYAEYMTVNENFAYSIPSTFSDAEAAPHLCAGAIGYRSVRLSRLKDGNNLGLTGFGASGHLVLKMVRHQYPHCRVYVFARSDEERSFARELGAVWAGSSEDASPEKLYTIIDTTPVWKPVVDALKNLLPGGRLVINAIRKEETDKSQLARLDYPADLWMEKEIKSVANVTRADVQEFLRLAAEIPLRPEIEEFPLESANEALSQLKTHKIRGAKVLRIAAD